MESMKKGIIIYQSKYGATKKYVDWLTEKFKFDCIETPNAKIKDIEKYNTIILCGGIYASGIAGLSFFRKNYDVLKNKKLAIFCVGASPFEEQAFNEVKAHCKSSKCWLEINSSLAPQIDGAVRLYRYKSLP